jgi:hypothetical protein
LSPSPSLHAPPQYDIGAPLITSGPVWSGSEATSIIAAQPPWQLPMIAGFALFGCSSRTLRTNCRSASQTSMSVWPGSGSGWKMTK